MPVRLPKGRVHLTHTQPCRLRCWCRAAHKGGASEAELRVKENVGCREEEQHCCVTQ